MTTTALEPGLLVLQGNRLEWLADAVFRWTASHPLGPLEEETILVASHGMAEWLKIRLAQAQGVCAAVRVELPARFMWRAWRAVLGRGAVPAASALDELPLTWRLMALLPERAAGAGFEPVAGFLGADGVPGPAGSGGSAGSVGWAASAASAQSAGPAGSAAWAEPAGSARSPLRPLQLAQRLADLFDQYQVYRGDWLDDWAAGHDVLRPQAGAPRSAAVPVPAAQRWQPALWRAVLAGLDPAERQAARPVLHRRFVAALQQAERGGAGGAPGARHATGVPGVNGAPGAPHATGVTGVTGVKGDTGINGVTGAPGGRPWPALPRRIVLFGTTHLPQATLEAIAALAPHCQVIVAAPNPCRVHWVDDADPRAAWRPGRGGAGAAAPAAGHPLLASWGRQSRDFIRQLDAHDAARGARDLFALPRVDLFDTAPATTLLQQVQAMVRDGVPLAEHAATARPPAPHDRSIVFHVAHGAHREVEILHDQLLRLFEQPPGGRALEPRDVVVMVPDVEVFAPAIAAVFGQHAPGDARRIPWAIADRGDRGHHPLLVALEWLLRAPSRRFTASELRALLDVPAVARRHGIDAADLPTLLAWIDGAGVRWGLDADHRAGLGLGECGDANTWHAGLQRMLLGYATGRPAPGDDGVAGIDPYDEVGGLEAALAGALAELVATLRGWWSDAAAPRTPARWVERLRALVADVFAAPDPADRVVLAVADAALAAWLDACERGGFDSPVDLAVAREAWLGGIDAAAGGTTGSAGGGSRRFHAGGVTFCTLLPLRAIPFEVVCLLGMNDGDYPRRAPRSDFDLMALPGQTRPGDRSRRDDDRQLMLDALLAARRVLYVSWTGRSARDNQPQPPSVLVSQLRDHLAAGWGRAALAQRTTEHPLQPFSGRYFEGGGGVFEGACEGALEGAREGAREGALEGACEGAPEGAMEGAREGAFERAMEGVMERPRGGVFEGARKGVCEGTLERSRAGLFTYAAEWRDAHDAAAASAPAAPPPAAAEPLTLQQLARFVRNPVQAFFRHRLRVAYEEAPPAVADDEAFAVAGLDRWRLFDTAVQRVRAALADSYSAPADDAALVALARAQAARLRRAGCLPLGAPGDAVEAEIAATLLPMLRQWQSLRAAHPVAWPALPLRLAHPALDGLAVDDWLGGLRAAAGSAAPVWIELQAARVAADDRRVTPRIDKLALPWLRCLAAAACGLPAAGWIVGADAVLTVRPPPRHEAEPALHALFDAWRDGVLGDAPLPTAVATGLALLEGRDPRKVYEGSDRVGGDRRDPCLARLYPDFDALAHGGGFEAATQRLYRPLLDWARGGVEVVALPGAADLPGDGDG